jgi:hypothetical protein
MLRHVLKHGDKIWTANSLENSNSDDDAEFDSFRKYIIFLVSPNFILEIKVDAAISFSFREEMFCGTPYKTFISGGTTR